MRAYGKTKYRYKCQGHGHDCYICCPGVDKKTGRSKARREPIEDIEEPEMKVFVVQRIDYQEYHQEATTIMAICTSEQLAIDFVEREAPRRASRVKGENKWKFNAMFDEIEIVIKEHELLDI